MADPFLAEIRLFSFNFPPRGWALCNGQSLQIAQNQALFSLMGTTYGGNGQTVFSLPDLRGRLANHMNGQFIQGERGGEENHTLTQSEMPTHNHILNASSTNAGAVAIPTSNYLSNAAPNEIFSSGSGLQAVALQPATISNIGGSQPHYNMQPYLVLNFCVALQGIFPSRN
jgi:microcystin-dependent protein